MSTDDYCTTKKDIVCRILLFFLLAIILLITLVPLIYSNGQIIGLDGSVGVIDNSSVWDKLDPVSKITGEVCDLLCHQKESRSLIICGSQLPLCVRDYFLIIGVVIGLILTDHRVNIVKNDIFLLITGVLFIGAMIAEWCIENQNNLNLFELRTVTSLLCGIGSGFVYSLIIKYFVKFVVKIKNNTDKE